MRKTSQQLHDHVSVKSTAAHFITARCYAERDYATSSVRLSVCLSVTLRYDIHADWNTSKTISRPKVT